MASESSMPPPPPSGGGAAKYVVILLILLLGGGGIWFATRSTEEAAAPPAPKAAERSTALTEDALEIPEPEEELPEEEEEEVVPEEPVEETTKAPARPARDPWACSGDLEAKEIRKVITASYATIRSCYERKLKSQNMLQGSINLQVKVGPGGAVVATRVRGTLKDPEVRACVQGQAKGWTFPSPTGGCVVFDAPYNFTPKN